MGRKVFLITFLLGFSIAYGKVYELTLYKELKSKTPPSPPSYLLYTVRKGDCLLKIMKKFHIPSHELKEIVKLNNIKNPNLIYAGRKLKLPVYFGKVKVSKKTLKQDSPYLEGLKLLGAEVETKGALFVDGKKISFRKNPKIRINGEDFIYLNDCNSSLKKALNNLGIGILNYKNVKELFEETLSSQYPFFQKDGNLTLGISDILNYHYDYMAYDPSRGLRVVINLISDTPNALKELLSSYSVKVVQPENNVKTDLTKSESLGTLKILTGNGKEKLIELVKLLTGEEGEIKENALVFPKSKIYALLGEVMPQEKVSVEMKGYRVVRLTGDFEEDAEKILSLIPFAVSKVILVLKEPPESGKRSIFKKEALEIDTPSKTYYLVDTFDRIEEIPYLRYRGVNLIIY